MREEGGLCAELPPLFYPVNNVAQTATSLFYPVNNVAHTAPAGPMRHTLLLLVP